MTADDRNKFPDAPLSAKGGRIVTSFSDTVDLTAIALELWVLTAGTASVVGADGTTVTFTEADITALGGRLPFAVKRILSTGTTATRFLAAV